MNRIFIPFNNLQNTLRTRDNDFSHTLLFPSFVSLLVLAMSSTKKDAATPRQATQKARDDSSLGNANASRGGFIPSVGSLPPNSTSRRSSRLVGSPRGSSSSLSPSILEYARRTQTEAQAHRTSTRIAELEFESHQEERNDAVGIHGQEEKPFEREYPGTAARKNITVRRSRDRLSGRPVVLPRTPENLLRRRSLERPQDKRSDEKGQQSTRGAAAVVHVRRHGEELQGSYPSLNHDDHRRPYFDGQPVPREFAAQWPWGGSKSPSVHGEDEDDNPNEVQEEESSDEGDEPLFLRRDIPSARDAPEVHERLTQLWQLRQKASHNLVDALDKDDSILFDKLESTMRLMNQGMHQVLRDYLDEGAIERRQSTFVDVDSLPMPPVGSSPSRLPVEEVWEDQEGIRDLRNTSNTRSHPAYRVHPPVPAYRKDTSSTGVSEGAASPYGFHPSQFPTLPVEGERIQTIRIILDYEDNQVYRTISVASSNLDIHHLAIEYLMDVFDTQVTNFADFLLTCDDQEIPFRGFITEIPIEDGAVIDIAFRKKGNHTPDPKTPKRVPSSFPDGSSRGYKRGESHSLKSARTPRQPGNNGGAIGNEPYDSMPTAQSRSGPYDKIKQSFKCPRFSGQQKDWKQWNKGFVRYLSIWDLEHVLDPDFVEDGYPLPANKQQENKMVFLILEDAVQSSPMASSYVRQAPAMNGFEAYYTLHDGFVFAGATTSTLLLNELSNFRFLPNETPTALVLRLEELFQELELLPSEAAVTFIDTQKIGYLLNALRHEEEWNVVSSYITSAQIKGQITFREACEELKVRCETARAHDMLDRPVKGKKVQNLLVKTDE